MKALWTPMRQAAHAVWQQRAPRERRLLALGAAVLLGAALWRLLLAPAWQVWREAPAQQARLEAQTRHMLHLQTEARQLQAPSRIERGQALAWLNANATALLGPSTQLNAQGDELRVTLQATPASGLAQWLAEARENAQTRPRLAQLQKQPAPSSPSAATHKDNGPTWSGTLVMQLP